MGLDGIHPRIIREVAEELSKPLSIIYHHSWLTREVRRSQTNGGWPVWHPFPRRAGRRTDLGTTGLPAWPQCRARLWSRSPWVWSQGTHGTAGSAGMGKASPAWPTWPLSAAGWVTKRMRKSLWMLSFWISAKPLALSPRALSWKTRHSMVWTGTFFAGLRGGPRECG